MSFAVETGADAPDDVPTTPSGCSAGPRETDSAGQARIGEKPVICEFRGDSDARIVAIFGIRTVQSAGGSFGFLRVLVRPGREPPVLRRIRRALDGSESI